MTTVYINGQSMPLRDDQAIGKGGEADVFDIGGGRVLKVYKPPDHPDYAGNPVEQEGAKRRIEEHQTKLPDFPKGLPSHLVAPLDLAFNSRKKIVGYTMPFLRGTEPILRLGERSFRETGFTDEMVAKTFRSLYQTVFDLHEKCVIGDFNDLNVLVKGQEAFVIDADSMQFGKYLCRVFTGKFVDPLLCNPNASAPMLCKPHNYMSDWFAYLVMFMQSFLFVGPYGGVYKPTGKSKRVSHDARPLHRITVWHPDVRYPKPAKPLNSLPDTLLDYFSAVFQKDRREIPPLSILDTLQFDAQGNLLVTTKVAATPAITKQIITGTVRAEKIFDTTGRIVFAIHHGGKLRWLYHHDGQYKREDGSVVVKGPLTPNIRFRISGDKSILAQGGQALVFTSGNPDPERISVDTLAGQFPLIDATEHSVLFVSNGELRKTTAMGAAYAEVIGTVLPNQTLFWASERLGFGFYRAGQLARYFVFDPRHRGINDGVELPPQSGQLIDSTCFFGKDRAWFFMATRESGQTINHCYLIDLRGKVLASAQAQEGAGTWLGTIRGKCGIGDFLLAATDDGIQRVQSQGSELVVTKEFPDTVRVVDADCHLFLGTGGLSVVTRDMIWNVTIS